MYPDCCHFSYWRLYLAASVATLLMAMCGCSLMDSGAAAGGRPWSDQMGTSMRRTPQTAAADAPAKKQPFWEKYRDQRVSEIDQNLGMVEPSGW